MSIADRIRKYAFENYILPARKNNRTVVAMRAKDIHNALELDRNWRNVCQSLRGQKFQTQYGLSQPHEIASASQGDSGTTIFVYDLN